MKKLRKRLVSVIASFMTLSSSYYINNLSAVAMEPINKSPAYLTFDEAKTKYKIPNGAGPTTVRRMIEDAHAMSLHEGGLVIKWLKERTGEQGEVLWSLGNGLIIDITNGQLVTYDLILSGKLHGIPVMADLIDQHGKARFNHKPLLNYENDETITLNDGGNWNQGVLVEPVLTPPAHEAKNNYKVIGGKLKNTQSGNYVKIQCPADVHNQPTMLTEEGATSENAWTLTYPETFGIEKEQTQPAGPGGLPHVGPNNPPPPPNPVGTGSGSGSGSGSDSSTILPYVLVPVGLAAVGGTAGTILYVKNKNKRSNSAPADLRQQPTTNDPKKQQKGGNPKKGNQNGNAKDATSANISTIKMNTSGKSSLKSNQDRRNLLNIGKKYKKDTSRTRI